MRSSDDQLDAILKKANVRRKQKKRRARILRETCLSFFCLCLVITAALLIPGTVGQPGAKTEGNFGSLILSSPFVGFIVIGVLSFVLGVSLTLLCLHLRRGEERKGNDDD